MKIKEVKRVEKQYICENCDIIPIERLRKECKIKDYFEDSEYNFDGEISEYLEGFEHIETAVDLFNQAQTTYLCGSLICSLDLEEEFYRYIHESEEQ